MADPSSVSTESPSGVGPWGDSERHLLFELLERGLARLRTPLGDGVLEGIVSRGPDGVRDAPARVLLTPEEGVPGDAWARRWAGSPSPSAHLLDTQISVMRVDVARLFANGQPLSLFGDNLLVDLDLSSGVLPTGSRVQVGAALLEVTPEPHTGCVKFRQRFGADALRLTAEARYRDLRLRGIYMKVLRAGEAALGDAVRVLGRD